MIKGRLKGSGSQILQIFKVLHSLAARGVITAVAATATASGIATVGTIAAVGGLTLAGAFAGATAISCRIECMNQ
jgi:hypothetical protein